MRKRNRPRRALFTPAERGAPPPVKFGDIDVTSVAITSLDTADESRIDHVRDNGRMNGPGKLDSTSSSVMSRLGTETTRAG